VLVEATDGVLRITIDRPDHKGAIDMMAVRRMVEALECAATDDALRVVVISSAGDDFCSGADWVATNASDEKPRPGSLQRRTPLEAHRLVELILEIQLPVVCAVKGWAVGLGCQIALASDFTVAAEESQLWMPFVTRGFTPDSGTSWLLPRMIGVARAKELLLLGRPVKGAEAAAWGMILRAVPATDVVSTVADLTGELAHAATVAVGLAKRCVNESLDGGISEAMARESMALELSSRTADFREGLGAFREHRNPDFRGR
jgi:2-(1,2-epoxy-1,2-dihydrophenyl)acetyl-CoA isomerase